MWVFDMPAVFPCLSDLLTVTNLAFQLGPQNNNKTLWHACFDDFHWACEGHVWQSTAMFGVHPHRHNSNECCTKAWIQMDSAWENHRALPCSPPLNGLRRFHMPSLPRPLIFCRDGAVCTHLDLSPFKIWYTEKAIDREIPLPCDSEWSCTAI